MLENEDHSMSQEHSVSLRDLPLDPPPFTEEKDLENLKKSVPPSGVEAYDNKIDEALNHAAASLKQVRRISERVQEVKNKNLEDDLQDNLSARTNTFRFAESKKNKINETIAEAYTKVDMVATEIEKNTQRPPEATDYEAQFGEETRRYVANMEPEERNAFINEKVTEGEWEVVDTILRGPSFLSGMGDKQKEQIMSLYREERYGKQMKTKEALQQVAAQVQHTGRDFRTKVKRLKSPRVSKALKSHKDAAGTMGDIPIKIYQ